MPLALPLVFQYLMDLFKRVLILSEYGLRRETDYYACVGKVDHNSKDLYVARLSAFKIRLHHFPTAWRGQNSLPQFPHL